MEFVLSIIGALLLAAAISAFVAWLVMLALGALASLLAIPELAVGFLATWLILFVVHALFGVARNT